MARESRISRLFSRGQNVISGPVELLEFPLSELARAVLKQWSPPRLPRSFFSAALVSRVAEFSSAPTSATAIQAASAKHPRGTRPKKSPAATDANRETRTAAALPES